MVNTVFADAVANTLFEHSFLTTEALTVSLPTLFLVTITASVLVLVI